MADKPAKPVVDKFAEPITDKDKLARQARREELAKAVMKANQARKFTDAKKKSPVGTFVMFLVLVAVLLAASKLGYLDRFFGERF